MASIIEIMQLCRLCLVKEQVNVPIFEEHGDIQQIIQKISTCLPVKVSKEDKLPKKICDGCSYKLELLYQFRNTTVNAEKQLLSWINQLGGETAADEVAKSQMTTQHTVKQEVDVTDTLDNPDAEYLLEQQLKYTENEAPFTESQDDNGAGDDDISNSSDDEPLSKRRKRLLESQGQLDVANSNQEEMQHMAVTKTEDASESEGEEKVDDPQPNFVSVGTSDVQQPGPSGLGKAVADIPRAKLKEDDNVENTSCRRCNKTYSSRRAYTRHRHRCNKAKNIACGICDKMFKTSHERNQHVRATHNENKEIFACNMCDDFFLTKAAYERHENKHLNIHKFSCGDCGKKFHIKASLDHHIALQHKGIRYTCEECGKSFASEAYFKKHSVTHKEDYIPPSFHCLECGKIYNRKSSLAMHMQAHRDASTRFFVCEVCGKSVCSKTSLRQHVMLHTGEKPFKCELCGRSFNKQTIWKSHMRTHTKSKPFICNICGKAFSQRTPLTVHLRYHSGEKPYACLICHKKFYTRTLLKTHSKIHGIPLGCL